MKKLITFFKMQLQYLLPHHLVSRFFGKLDETRWFFILTWVIKLYIRYYGVDMSEAEKENPSDYKTFNDFFTRKLKQGVRPIYQQPATIVSPVDGIISQIGNIDNNRLIQAKGIDYSLAQLLANNNSQIKAFSQGRFATLYLSPRHYHGVHMPLTGSVATMTYVAGKLFSVSQLTTTTIPRLFTINERAIIYCQTAFGPMAIIMVGAMLIASLYLIWEGKLTRQKKINCKYYSPQSIQLQRGEKIGHFAMGSTVILLFNKQIEWRGFSLNQDINMGQPIGHINGMKKHFF